MGATRESSWSGGTVAVASGPPAVACCGAGLASKLISPGTSTTEQTLATRFRMICMLSPDRTSFGFIVNVLFRISIVLPQRSRIPVDRYMASGARALASSLHFLDRTYAPESVSMIRRPETEHDCQN